MNMKQVTELILQSLEHEMGGVKVYEAAIKCAKNRDLKDEWTRYLDETKKHVAALQRVCQVLGVDPKMETPGRAVVRHNGAALVQAIEMARKNADPAGAQLVACECVVLAETKDHADWELIGQCAQHATGKAAEALREAYEEIENQEDEHLYHTKGWCRELWLESLGIAAVLPPPEERKKVKTAIGAAMAQQLADVERLTQDEAR